MTVALVASGGNKSLATTTLTWSGLANSTNYTVSVTDPNGFIDVREVMSDGSGGLVVLIVPQLPGQYQTDLVATVQTSLLTSTFNIGGEN